MEFVDIDENEYYRLIEISLESGTIDLNAAKDEAYAYFKKLHKGKEFNIPYDEKREIQIQNWLDHEDSNSDMTTIDNRVFAMDENEDDGVPGEVEHYFTDSELKDLFLDTLWIEREKILRYFHTRTPEQQREMKLETLIDMIVGNVLQVIDGLNPVFPAIDLNVYPTENEVFLSNDGKEKFIEEGMLINDNFLSESWESVVLERRDQPSIFEELNENSDVDESEPTIH